jgi:ribosomal protein L37E
MKVRIHKNGDVSFVKEDGDSEFVDRGFGFINDDKTIALIRCPECGAENYAPNVISGSCTWCPFYSNKISFE